MDELQTDKAVAEKDYKEAIGKLRYAINLHQSKTSEGSPSKDQVLQQNGASGSRASQHIAQQHSAVPSSGCLQSSTVGGLGAVGDAGAGPPGLAHQAASHVVASGESLQGPPQANSNKENSEAQPDRALHAVDNFQLPQAALDMHRKIASATAHILAHQLDNAPPGTEECPVCNEYMLDKCALTLVSCDQIWPIAVCFGNLKEPGNAIRSIPPLVARLCKILGSMRMTPFAGA